MFENALTSTMTELVESGKRVIFVHSVPELDFRPSTCVDSRPLRLTNHVKTPCSIERKLVTERQKTYRRIVKKVLDKFPEVQVVDPIDALCTTKECFAMDGKSVLYRDHSHLSVDGSFFVANKLPLFKDSGAETP